jgi:hypothetical protein
LKAPKVAQRGGIKRETPAKLIAYKVLNGICAPVRNGGRHGHHSRSTADFGLMDHREVYNYHEGAGRSHKAIVPQRY